MKIPKERWAEFFNAEKKFLLENGNIPIEMVFLGENWRKQENILSPSIKHYTKNGLILEIQSDRTYGQVARNIDFDATYRNNSGLWVDQDKGHALDKNPSSSEFKDMSNKEIFTVFDVIASGKGMTLKAASDKLREYGAKYIPKAQLSAFYSKYPDVKETLDFIQGQKTQDQALSQNPQSEVSIDQKGPMTYQGYEKSFLLTEVSLFKFAAAIGYVVKPQNASFISKPDAAYLRSRVDIQDVVESVQRTKARSQRGELMVETPMLDAKGREIQKRIANEEGKMLIIHKNKKTVHCEATNQTMDVFSYLEKNPNTNKTFQQAVQFVAELYNKSLGSGKEESNSKPLYESPDKKALISIKRFEDSGLYTFYDKKNDVGGTIDKFIVEESKRRKAINPESPLLNEQEAIIRLARFAKINLAEEKLIEFTNKAKTLPGYLEATKRPETLASLALTVINKEKNEQIKQPQVLVNFNQGKQTKIEI